MDINNRAKLAATAGFVLFASLLFHMQTCTATNSILTPNTTIKDGETLISQGEDFALGFFFPPNSTNRYAGIWYNKIPQRTVVWVANRENPLADPSGVITIDAYGNLVILDGRKRVFWSTNISTSARISHAELVDSGNLLLRELDSFSDNTTKRVLWESFSYPSDTFLQTMKLSTDPESNESTNRITSWRSISDPSVGSFSLGIDPQKLPQAMIWGGAAPRWRSGPWNDRIFLGVPDMDYIYLSGFDVKRETRQGKIVISYSDYYNDSSYTHLVLDSMGKLKQLGWEEEKKEWFTVWSAPDTECDIYGRCGAFGRCKNQNSGPICSCLKGFEPKNVNEWSRGNWSGGCVRRKPLQCEENGKNGDGFLKMERIKLPDFADSFAGGRVEECEEVCRKNCSCIAFAYDSGIGCLFWSSGDLMDIQEFSSRGLDFYIRLPDSELDKKRDIKAVVIPTVLTATLILIVCIYLSWWWMANQREKDHCKRKDEEMLHVHMMKGIKASTDSLDGRGTLRYGVKGTIASDLPLFGLSEVAIATDNFCDENKLGEGGFGSVYKGKLPGGLQIAVKRLCKSSGQGLEEFKNEAVLISRVQHRNLVRLLGCCVDGEEKILLYEYMPNRSLDAFLFGSSKKQLLDWGKRFHIIEGIARGLLYLHRDSRLKIIHRDLKASNILLDDGLNPKISDFGMARILGEEQILARTTRVVGTYGYMSPEYAMQGRFSEKSDVFSFGVLLLEIVGGKKNASFYRFSSNLLSHAWQLWNDGKVLELIDPALGGSYEKDEVLRCIHLGLLCVQEFAKDRPSMSSVVSILSCDILTLPAPKQPAFTERSALESDSLQRNIENFSINGVSITDTMFQGR